MTLRARLLLGIFFIAGVLVIPLWVALHSLEGLHEHAAEMLDYDFAASLLLGRIRVGTEDLRRAEDALLFVHDAASRDRVLREVSALQARADSLARFALDSAAVDVKNAVAEVAHLAPEEYTAAVAGKTKRADSLSAKGVRPALARIEASTMIAERALRDRTRQRVENASGEAEQARTLAIALLVFAAIVALTFALWLTRSVSKPVRDLETGMEAVAGGEFSYRLSVTPSRRDEFGRLSASFYSMSRQLAELDKLKAEFVSVASHELKTPVNVLLGYLQLLQEGVYGDLTERQLEVCRTLEVQCMALGRLVKQLLDVSRFEAGGGKLEVRRFALGPFLDDLETAFQVLALQRGVDFLVMRAAGLPESVLWDPDRINEVLGNLLSNAFKFTPRGGRVELRLEAQGETIQMVVRDTGAGIAPEQLPRIFDKFYQADNQGSADSEGTGLGLAIAKGIVEAHSGTINVDSTPGVGTTFVIELPIAFPLAARRHRVSPIATDDPEGVLSRALS
ncbi:MAG TPA: ATP-binding protein [Gemmatimonadaceae bacterium]|nr:ATP-binding protein [Gemmatimonadaceae bacterium]